MTSCWIWVARVIGANNSVRGCVRWRMNYDAPRDRQNNVHFIPHDSHSPETAVLFSVAEVCSQCPGDCCDM